MRIKTVILFGNSFPPIFLQVPVAPAAVKLPAELIFLNVLPATVESIDMAV